MSADYKRALAIESEFACQTHARLYRDKLHWTPLVLAGKAPTDTGWSKRTVESELPTYGPENNIGILLGKPSAGLCRLDPDFPQLPGVTRLLFPEASLTYTRASSPMCGRLLKCDIKSKNYNLPKSCTNLDAIPKNDDGKDKLTVFQILSTGKQTMVPPSVHPGSGERLEWVSPPEETAIAEFTNAAELERRVGIEAFLMVVTHFWPGRGTRNEAALALGRVLLEVFAYMSDIEERCTLVDDLVVEVAMQGGDGAESATGKENRARVTLEKMEAGEETTGLTRLIELLELPENVLKTFQKWLGMQVTRTRSTIAPKLKVKAEAEAEFIRDHRGAILANEQVNVRVALKKLGIGVRFNEFTGQYHLTGCEGFGPLLEDAAMDRIWLKIDETFAFRPSMGFFQTVTTDLARRSTFHPVKDYFASLKWDGKPRLDAWLTVYAKADLTEYTSRVGAIVLIAAIRRIKQPGCKFDELLVLESETQGTEKSSSIAALAVNPDWFEDHLPLNADPKLVIEQTRGKWIIEASDLAGHRKAELEQLKAMLSRQHDHARLAYGRLPVDVPRQWVAIGTTNSTKYLSDPTGNRRFWPVRIRKLDVEHVKRDRDQLWAEAVVREAAGESIRLERHLWPVAEIEQEKRVNEDPWLETLEELGLHTLDGKKITTTHLWELLDVKGAQCTQANALRLRTVMLKLGWRRPNDQGRLDADGKKVTGYVIGESPWELVCQHRDLSM